MKTDHGSTITHPSLATLHRLFDGHAVDAATARHARDCSRCAHQLQALTDQRTALGHLLHRDANWVLAAQRHGRGVLADLLAELARACLARREAGQRKAPLSELPRPIERVTADIRTLVLRLTRLAATASTLAPSAAPRGAAVNWSDLERLAQRRETDPELLRHGVAALRALEGDSLRWRALDESSS
jgi:hypothetical protein